MSEVSQNNQIISYLKIGGPLTPYEALRIFGCLRLSARVYELKKKGWPISKDLITVGHKKQVAKYYLNQNKNSWPI